MMVLIGKGIASNLMDLFCNRGLTDLVFNGKKYSSIQTLYKEEVNTKKEEIKEEKKDKSKKEDVSKKK